MKQPDIKDGAFSKENSFAIKGIAILMMMWHHCFLTGRFEKYSINFWPLSAGRIENIAVFCKICVSLFVFISGYGLYHTWQKAQKEKQSVSRWVCEKLIRTLSNYWFIVVLAWIVCTFLDNRPYHVYGFERSRLLGAWNMLIDFLGLTNLTKGPQLNGTWWYMSAAIVFIVIFPLIYEGFKRTGCLVTLGIILIFPRVFDGYPGETNLYSFLPIFCIGMIFARYDLFAAWRRFWSNRAIYIRVFKCLFMLGCLFIIYKLSHSMSTEYWWDVKWNLFPLLVIVFSYDYLFRIPILNGILVFLGKHATNIFLVHTFIRSTYYENFVYNRGHFVLILGTLLVTSLGISLVIEGLKKGIRYEKWIHKLTRFCRPNKEKA